MKKVWLLSIFIFAPIILSAQIINGRITSSVYSFERFQNVGESNTYVRTFQTLNFSLRKNKFSLKTRMNFEADVATPLDNDPRLRFYNLYLEYRNIFDILTVRLGRQSLFNGIAGGLYDGVNLKLKYAGFSLTGYYGGNVPAYQKLQLTDSWNTDYILGGKLTINAIKNLRVAVSYVDKNYKAISYSALRLDSLFNPINYLVQKNSNQFAFLSGEVGYRIKGLFRIDSRVDYDLNFVKFSKVNLRGRFEGLEDIGINVYYNYREPRIRYNSILSVFNYANTQELEAGVDYKITEDYTLLTKYGVVNYKDANSTRISVGLIGNFFSINYRKNLGYAGEMDAISFSLGKSFMEGLISPTVGFSYSNYKLSSAGEKEKLLTIVAGTNVRAWRSVSFDIQGQYLSNKFYNKDFRVFFRISHWFNTNLSML